MILALGFAVRSCCTTETRYCGSSLRSSSWGAGSLPGLVGQGLRLVLYCAEVSGFLNVLPYRRERVAQQRIKNTRYCLLWLERTVETGVNIESSH